MTEPSLDPSPVVPNHHADHPGFSGFSGWIAGLTMRVGRTLTAELAVETTGVQPGDCLVDIGCGPGIAARLGADRGATVTGVDPATVMLRTARKSDRKHAVTWKQGVAEALPLPDRSQDIAWSLSTVHHWPDITGGLSEVRRVLKPGGRFLATERRVKPDATGLASHGWTTPQAERFAEMCEEAGLRGVEVASHDTKHGAVLAVLAHSGE